MNKRIFYFHGLQINVISENEHILNNITQYHEFLKNKHVKNISGTINITIDSSKNNVFEDEYFGTVIVENSNVVEMAYGKKITEVSINPNINEVSAVVSSMDGYAVEVLFEALFMQPIKYLAKKYGIFFMHASSVALDREHGIIFLGNPHAGKSTFALTLLMNGYYYLAEESPAISMNNDELFLYGFPEPIGVSEGSLKNFPALKKYCNKTTGQYLKHRIKFDKIFSNKTLDKCIPCAVFFPHYRETDDPLDFHELNKVEAMRELMSLELKVYTDDFNRSLTKEHMRNLGALAERARVFHLYYNDSHLAQIPEAITNLIKS
jgi:hypothetical protein